jgi:hypothetical protein
MQQQSAVMTPDIIQSSFMKHTAAAGTQAVGESTDMIRHVAHKQAVCEHT